MGTFTDSSTGRTHRTADRVLGPFESEFRAGGRQHVGEKVAGLELRFAVTAGRRRS